MAENHLDQRIACTVVCLGFLLPHDDDHCRLQRPMLPIIGI